ncbi:MAG: hypothetical protein JWM58_376 [Rhizobium sp.]|nr:hypothetical protein [Rhizobium sp.]
MGDRNHGDNVQSIAVFVDGNHNNAGPIFRSLFATTLVFF